MSQSQQMPNEVSTPESAFDPRLDALQAHVDALAEQVKSQVRIHGVRLSAVELRVGRLEHRRARST